MDLNTWVAQSIERAIATVHSRTQEGLAVLATVGSTAPFVGLFGTVWGIYNALVKIGASGQASIDKVAGPVGEALIMTALGLAVAVPAVLGYNWLVRRNRVAMDTVRAFGSDLHTVLLAAGAAAGADARHGRPLPAPDARGRRDAARDDQHDAARRRHAGAADHLPHHHPGREQLDRVTLPRESTQASEEQPQNIIVTVDAQGAVYWFDTPVATTQQLAEQLAREVAARSRNPNCTSAPMRRADYEAVGQVVYAAQQAGIEHVGFLTEPPQR